jgi:PAS domain S-box-containing protein
VNSTRLDQILRQAIIVPILAVLVGASALALQMNQAFSTVARIEAADETISRAVTLDALGVDQETGLRGYQTTSDPQFLAPYNNAVVAFPIQLARLRACDSDPEFQDSINEINNAHDAWQAGFADPLIASIRDGAKTDDVDLNLLGKHQMDSIRLNIEKLTLNAQRRRDRYIAHWRGQVRLMLIGLGLIAVAIGIIIGLYTRRQLQEVSRAFSQYNQNLLLRAEQIFRSEQKLRTTLQSIGDGVITCNAEGNIETMNEVAQQLTGWSSADAITRPLEEVFHIISHATRQPKENPVSKVQRLNRIVELSDHTILIQKQGSEIFIDDSGAPIRDKDGLLIGIVLVFRDITMAIKSQDALLANEKLAVAGRLAATIAHEIHNPLDSVSNLLFLMDGQSSPEETAQFLLLARQEIARVTQISRAMLSLYRESKAPVPIDLKEMLESILLLMDRRFAVLGVVVVPTLPPGLIINGFPAELRQVFTNLLTNAAEASVGLHTPAIFPAAIPDASLELTWEERAARPVAEIYLSTQPCPAHTLPGGLRREAGVMVTIRDSGPGISDEILANLFKPFFTTKGERGTGLGLWVSRGIMTKHGGSIELESSTDPIHHGTTAKVFLANNPTINIAGD